MKWITKKISDFTPEQYNKCVSLMTQDRKAYLDTVNSKERKLSSVCAEWCIKELVSDFADVKIEDITILRNEKGKPYLKDLPFHISISHSENLVAAVVSHTPIGIDTERIKDRDLKLCRKACTEKEEEIIKNSTNALKEFYKIWTTKEAYFKMLGTGITDLKSVSYFDINGQHFYEDDYIITITK